LEITIESLSLEDLKVKYSSDEELGFGQVFTDRMFIVNYEEDQWKIPRIVKYDNIELNPSAVCLHYGQTIFEGQKAYRTPEGNLNLFRLDKNIERFNSSARRLVMPEIDEELYRTGLITLLKLEKDWAPKKLGSSLYIRPTMIATTPMLGLRTAQDFIFYIILSPSGPYFPEGFQCVNIYVSENYIRAAPGGMGNVKTGGNYAASLLVTAEATRKGFNQVLWLDAIHKRYIEEVGAMNIFFIIDDEIFTPPLSGTILPGITRESILTLANDSGYYVREKALSIDFVIESIGNGSLTECFAAGTAASVAPIGSLYYQDKSYMINKSTVGPISKLLYTNLIDIQYGRKEDPYGWIETII